MVNIDAKKAVREGIARTQGSSLREQPRASRRGFVGVEVHDGLRVRWKSVLRPDAVQEFVGAKQNRSLTDRRAGIEIGIVVELVMRQYFA